MKNIIFQIIIIFFFITNNLKANPPKRADTVIYYDAIAIGKKCKDLKLNEENNSCKKLK